MEENKNPTREILDSILGEERQQSETEEVNYDEINYDEIYNEENYLKEVIQLITSDEFKNFYVSLSEQDKMKSVARDVISLYKTNGLINSPLILTESQKEYYKKLDDYLSKIKSYEDLHILIDNSPLEDEEKKTR